MYDKVSEESELAAEEGFTVEDVSPTESSEYYYNDNGDDIDQEKEVTTKKPVSSLRSRTRPNIRKSASQAYKERLRKRVEKEKVKLQLAELASKKFSSRTHAKKYNEPEEETGTEAPRFKSRSRSIARARSFETDEVFTEAENEEEAQARSLSGFGSRSSRPVRQRPSFRRNRFSQSRESNSGFKPRTSSFSSRNRFKSRFEKAESEEITRAPQTTKKSVSTRKKSSGLFDSGEKENKNPVVIKKFNKFERPDYRKTLLKKLFDKRPDIKQRIEERKEKDKKAKEAAEAQEESNDKHVIDEDEDLAFPDDHESAPSALVPSIVDDENILQNIDNEEIRLERLLTTLEVSTLYPKELSENYLEIATIRSPYTFNIEDNEKSTRFITITKSVTRSLDISPSHSFTAPPPASSVSSIRPSSVSKPLFDTNSIPAPENILASTALPRDTEPLIQGSSDIEYLAPLTLTSSLHQATPPLKTVTETLSTVETMTKKSILPVIFGPEESSLFTLTQTYSVTRIVTAVKTIPPMELYEFNPQQNFADFDALFEEAGSERRESLLPGELEFSDQDDFGLEGPSVVKVAPPTDFVKDLDLIGSKFDFVEQMEKHNNPALTQLKGTQPNIESSFGSPNTRLDGGLFNSPTQTQATPSLPDQGLAALGITPEQLLYLQLLQNPLAALGIGGAFQQPQVITETSPVYKTEPVIETSVIKVTFGAKEIFTTITETHGVTTKTDYITATKTVNGGGLGGITAALGGLSQLGSLGGQPEQAPGFGGLGLGGLVPSYTVVSSPVTRDTVVTETHTEEFKINFRNQELYTTITSTSLVTTQITSFITKTERVLPTANPLAGLLG